MAASPYDRILSASGRVVLNSAGDRLLFDDDGGGNADDCNCCEAANCSPGGYVDDFSDGFNDASIDSTWTTSGTEVVESGGVLRLNSASTSTSALNRQANAYFRCEWDRVLNTTGYAEVTVEEILNTHLDKSLDITTHQAVLYLGANHATSLNGGILVGIEKFDDTAGADLRTIYAIPQSAAGVVKGADGSAAEGDKFSIFFDFTYNGGTDDLFVEIRQNDSTILYSGSSSSGSFSQWTSCHAMYCGLYFQRARLGSNTTGLGATFDDFSFLRK